MVVHLMNKLTFRQKSYQFPHKYAQKKLLISALHSPRLEDFAKFIWLNKRKANSLTSINTLNLRMAEKFDSKLSWSLIGSVAYSKRIFPLAIFFGKLKFLLLCQFQVTFYFANWINGFKLLYIEFVFLILPSSSKVNSSTTFWHSKSLSKLTGCMMTTWDSCFSSYFGLKMTGHIRFQSIKIDRILPDMAVFSIEKFSTLLLIDQEGQW